MVAVHTSMHRGQWIAGTPYRVVRSLGTGGMGEVYEVDHLRTGTRRALKVVRERMMVGDRVVLARFVREARVLRSIVHPHVVTVFEGGVLRDGRPYYTMELLRGLSFGEFTRQRACLPPRAVISMVVQALWGLSVIHRRGIVHRDIKPTNLFCCDDGQSKVLDLGIAKVLDPHETGPNTIHGTVIGTRRYMAPEQRWGGCVDRRADLYAMGLVLVELLLGRRCSDAGELRNQALRQECEHRVMGIDAVLQRALAWDSASRFASADQFATELTALCPVRAIARKNKPIGHIAAITWNPSDTAVY